MSYTMVRIHSKWIRSFLGSTITEPLTSKLKEANIYCFVSPGDIAFDGASGEGRVGVSGQS